MTVCGTVDPGSSPGTLAIQQGDNMKIETKKQKLGVVKNISNFGAGELIEIKQTNNKTFFLPLNNSMISLAFSSGSPPTISEILAVGRSISDGFIENSFIIFWCNQNSSEIKY